MTIWHTSDTHFGHARIISLCNRPFEDFFHMDNEIVRRWNTVVAPDDVVFHHGDVALGQIDYSLAKVGELNGYKILIEDGNHDRPFMNRGKARHQEWIDRYLEVFQEIRPAGSMPWTDGSFVNVSHFPYDGDSHGADRYAEDRLPDDGKVLIHGHSHSPEVISYSKSGTVQIHVGMDAHSFYPVSHEQIARYIEIAKEIRRG